MQGDDPGETVHYNHSTGGRAVEHLPVEMGGYMGARRGQAGDILVDMDGVWAGMICLRRGRGQV